MLQITAKHRIFIAVDPIDFRSGIDGIAAICRRQFQLDPMSGHYFLFRNRRGTSIKVLAYDSQGFWLCQKRLSKGKFKHWPNVDASMLYLDSSQMQVLLQNGDPTLVKAGTPWRRIDD